MKTHSRDNMLIVPIPVDPLTYQTPPNRGNEDCKSVSPLGKNENE